MTQGNSPKIPLHTKILLALVIGAVCGVSVNIVNGGVETLWLSNSIKYFFDPIGQIFLRMLFMTVIPLVFSSLALGVTQLGSGGRLGRIGIKTAVYFLLTMTCAVSIGLFLVNLVKPGEGLPEDIRISLMEKYKGDAEKKAGPTTFGVETFVNIVPRNPLKAMVEMDMLAVVCFALLIGVALTRIPENRRNNIVGLLEAINDLMVELISWAMRLAPLGVFALIFSVTARFGYALMISLGWYVAVVLVGIALQLFGVMPLLLVFIAKYNPITFFVKARSVVITAFSTSSSNATLPTSIKVAEEELGIPPAVAGFVLPLGATMNMNGTALFEGVTVMFLAQVFGVDLTIQQQLIVIVLAVLTAIGAAGVPGGSLPLLALVLNTVGVPPEGIALILGVDRLLDMCRTTLNVTADIVIALCIHKTESK
jgi:dicarboxylate/amino acid:cation (Na+ or H+) symporter, DAACS family